MIKIALAEDNAYLAESLKEKLSTFSDVHYKFHAENGVELLNKIDKKCRYRPCLDGYSNA